MGNPKAMGVFAGFFAALALSSCGGGGGMGTTSTQSQASIYTIGTDAPLPSVVSCEVNVSWNHVVQRHDKRERAIAATNCGFCAAQWFASVVGPHLRADRNVYLGDNYDRIAGDRVHRHIRKSAGNQYDQRNTVAIERDREFRKSCDGF